MYSIQMSTAFRRDVRRSKRQNKDMKRFQEVIHLLASGEQLSERWKDHQLGGEWRGFRECHLDPDWLLIYRVNRSESMIELVRMGSHADLFE